MARQIGNDARPRVLLVAGGGVDALAAELRNIVPLLRVVALDKLKTIRQQGYDAVVVLTNDDVPVENHLYGVYFFSLPRIIRTDGAGKYWAVGRGPGTYAEFFVVDDLASELGIDDLVDRTVIPVPGSAYPILGWVHSHYRTSGEPILESFARERDGQALAARFRRRDDESSGEAWWLPESAKPEAAAWIAAAPSTSTRPTPSVSPGGTAGRATHDG